MVKERSVVTFGGWSIDFTVEGADTIE